MKQKNKILIAIVVVIIAIVGIYYFCPKEPSNTISSDYKSISYKINGEAINLKNGIAETGIVPGSSSIIITKYFGNEVQTDLNGDGMQDVALLLTQNHGGSGTFYYVVAAIKNGNGYIGTNAIFLGDRISPQSTVFKDGKIVVNYADRRNSEPMTAKPTVGISRYFMVVDNELVEANDISQIINREWKWINAQMNNDETIVPNKKDAFSIIFGADGTVSGKTDCNSFSGKYTAAENKISLGSFASTKMFCKGSQESEFLKLLGEVDSFLISSGNLILQIKLDTGSMLFK